MVLVVKLKVHVFYLRTPICLNLNFVKNMMQKTLLCWELEHSFLQITQAAENQIKLKTVRNFFENPPKTPNWITWLKCKVGCISTFIYNSFNPQIFYKRTKATEKIIRKKSENSIWSLIISLWSNLVSNKKNTSFDLFYRR